MRKIITFISFLFVALLGYAQQGNVLYTLKATPNKVLADHFGHIYLIQNARLILLDEKGKEKAHEAAESETGQKIKSKAGDLFEKGKEKAHEFAESETGKKVKNKAEKLLDKGIDKAENVYEKHKERKAEQKEQPEDKE